MHLAYSSIGPYTYLIVPLSIGFEVQALDITKGVIGRVSVGKVGSRYQINAIAVDDPNDRQKGIGKAMVLAAIDKACNESLPILTDMELSQDAINFYQALEDEGILFRVPIPSYRKPDGIVPWHWQGKCPTGETPEGDPVLAGSPVTIGLVFAGILTAAALAWYTLRR